jgi:thioredoxin 1
MEITSEELQRKIENGEKLLVDFFTNWCGPCKVMKPMFEEASTKLMSENSEIKLYTMNLEKDKEYAINVLGIKSVPTIKGFVNGSEVYHNTGVLKTEQIIQVAKEL